MYILTNKALKEREKKAWADGNSAATKAWQSEFELLRDKDKERFNYLKNIIVSYNLDDLKKLKKSEIIEKFNIMSEELLDVLNKM